MKIVIKRVESINRRGITSKGKDYHIDVTNVFSDVPFETDDQDGVSFGTKELAYQVGQTPSHANYHTFKLAELKGRLPLECEVEMGQAINAYGQPVPCIVDIKIPPATKKDLIG